MVLGGGQLWKRIFEKTRVGFGRTELTLSLSCTEFCALSSGHGPRGQGFEGAEETLDFHDFLGRVVVRMCLDQSLKHRECHVKSDGKKKASTNYTRAAGALN